MENEIIKLLQAIDNKLEILNNSQNEVRDSLSTILMAIYDIDFTPNETDLSQITKGLVAIAKTLRDINLKTNSTHTIESNINK